ncbi:MAG: MMPL family transporter [Firmicutes bacterium]|nr:MMPL family transporter [Bacillota bacterium]
MLRFGQAVVRKRKIILIVAVLLLIPSLFGIINTRINYDVLTYLPDSIDTIKGQNILLDEFGKGGFSMVMVEGMSMHDVAKVKKQIEDVDHVASVIWYDTVLDLSVPETMLPESIYSKFNSGDTTLMAIFFDKPTSDDATLEAVTEIRHIIGKQGFISGMSCFVEDLKELIEHEEPIYVAVAVILAMIVLGIFMDSFAIPVIFITGIGLAILYNMGANIITGEISFITQAIASVLQLAVTTDYSIFLWHSYEEHRKEKGMGNEEAMANAIARTLVSVITSSTTTIAGFLALCFMTFQLGLDMGIVLARGVLIGVISSVTILPSMILMFDKLINKTRHKPVVPKFDKLSAFIVKRPLIFVAIFLILLGPAFYGYRHTDVYYKLDQSIPQSLPFAVANQKLAEDFNMNCTHMLLIDADTPQKYVRDMMHEIEDVDGVGYTLSLEGTLGPRFPDTMVPNRLRDELVDENYELAIINSEYAVASDEVNRQIDQISAITRKYDKGSLLIGEGPCTKDLIDITDRDFKVVTGVSVAAIFFILLIALQSISLPVILVASIELGIFINLGIPFYTGTVLAFITSIIISTVQLGSTVDYAILMTTRYKRERYEGHDKKEAIRIAHSTSMPSVMVSALSFFSATIGVGIYSDIDLIGSLCMLMARGAIISLFVVMFIVPSFFVIFDGIICRTGRGFVNKNKTADTSDTADTTDITDTAEPLEVE